MPVEWEGAEITVYCNGKACNIDLSPIQFAVIAKILGLQLVGNEITYFTDETLKQFAHMKGNPLRLKPYE